MSEAPKIVAIVLAAGRSSRMEAFKPLLPMGPTTILGETIARFHKAGVRDVRVVTGHRSLEIQPAVELAGARWVFNPDHETGMLSSIRAGIRTLEPDVSAFFLLPVDIALVKPRSIRILLDAFNPDALKILYPRFDGQRGHPPLIPKALLGEPLALARARTMREILEQLEHRSTDVDLPDEGILLDCDTPEEYRRLVERWAQEYAPSEAECDAICALLRVPERVVVHGRMVAEVARLLAVHLNRHGHSMDLPLILAAGRLHDVARDQPEHAKAGAALLSDLGYPRVGAVVARHTDLGDHGSSLSEADLVYLADKCVAEDRLVPLEERFAPVIHRHVDRPDILRKVQRRLRDAREIEARIEAAIGAHPSAVLHRYRRGIRASITAGRREIYLMRHGAIQSRNDPGRFIGQLDLPLTEEGLEQAEHLKSRLSSTSLSAVYCSDLKRSLQTAEVIGRDHGLSCIPKPGLREISLGDWEGLPFEEVRRRFPQEYRARGLDIVHYRPPGGESFLDCTFRVLPAFHEILRSTPGNIAIVAHAGVNRILLSQVLGRPLDDLFSIEQDYGCMKVIVQERGSFRLKDPGPSFED
ncbi:MAG: DVU_1551 family NTP transferase [Syntrophobacteraceae bacterium]